MATDVDVQYFSHLNGLTLGNNWGDLIRLLDTCLVNGLPLTEVTAASIDAQGDIHLTTYAAHNCMLFQIIELSSFVPAEINGKYRIKGVPSTTELILKAEHIGKSITTTGEAKLAPLGYDIIFRDTNDVKRVYRAKNPTAQHPFIRVDESLTSPDGTTGVYTSTYAKYAMVGLLEHMEHIDDYENPDVLQLPFDPADPAKNWKITGTGTAVIRGWSRWYWTKGWVSSNDTNVGGAANRNLTLCGDKNAFYMLRAVDSGSQNNKTLIGCGMYQSDSQSNVAPNWFLMTKLLDTAASYTAWINDQPDGSPLMRSDIYGGFYLTKNSATNFAQVIGRGIMPDYASGFTNKFSASQVATLTIPIWDADMHLRGGLDHICYAGNSRALTGTLPVLSDNSMYVCDSAYTYTSANNVGAFNFYLGELE